MEDFKKAFEKGKRFLFEPAKAFEKEKGTKIGEAFKYFLMMAVILAVLNGIVIGILSANGMALVITIITTYIGTVISAIVVGIVLHIFAYLVGARKGIEETFKVAFFGYTPSLLLGWIPFIGIIFGVWTVILDIIGLKHLQHLTTGRAILAVIIPIVILGILMIAGAAALFFMFGGLSMIPIF